MRGFGLLLLLVVVGAAVWLVVGAGQDETVTPGGLAGEGGAADPEENQPGLMGRRRAGESSDGDVRTWQSGTDTIHVRVVDATGAGMEGVPVALRARERAAPDRDLTAAERARARMGGSRRRPYEPYASKTSGPDGRLAFEGVHNVGQFRVRAEPDAPLCTTERRVPGSWGGRRMVPVIELTLVPGVPLGVHVVDGKGEGLRARVMWAAAVPGRPDASSIQSSEVMTGADGRGRFALVPAGSVTLRATAEGVGVVTGIRATAPHEGDVRIVLGTAEPSEIFGRVLHPDGSPVPNASLWLKTNSRRPPHFQSEHEAQGDGEGRYSIHGVGGDAVASLSVTAPGHVLRHQIHQHMPVPRGGRLELDILLPRGCVVQGQVVDIDGNEISYATVRPSPRLKGGWGQLDLPTATTDGEGRFRVEGLPSGSGQLFVSAEGFQSVGPKGPAQYSVPQSGDEQTVQVVLSRGATVAGTVSDPSGDPVVGVIVRLGTSSGDDYFQFRARHHSQPTDENGRFRIQGFDPDGKWLLRADGVQGYSDEVPLPVEDATGEREVLLVLEPGLTLSGAVVVGGRPVTAPVEISLSMGRGRFTRKVQTDASGAFVFRGLPPGEAELTLPGLRRKFARRRRGEDPLQAKVVLVEGKEPEPVRFDLPAMGVIGGTVVDKDGQPIAMQQVLLRTEPRSAAPQQYARTSDAGRFRFTDVLDGDHVWTLHAGATEHGVVRVGQEDLVVTAVRSNPNTKLPGALVRARVLLPGGGLLARGSFVVLAGESRRRLASGRVQDGQFQFRAYQELPATVRVEIEKPEDLYGTPLNVAPGAIDVATGSEVLEIRLRAGLRVAGRVLDEHGQPHEQTWCQVSIAPVAQPGTRQQQLPPRATQRVDKEGRFAFESLPAGRWRLSISAHASPFLKPQDVEVESGQEDLEYRLERGASISGTVVGPDGVPLKHASVMFQPLLENGRPAGNVVYATSQEDGTFEVGGIQAGVRGVLTARPPHDMHAKLVHMTKRNVSSGSTGHVMELQKGYFIRGRIDATGFEDALPPRFSVDAVMGEGASAQYYRATSNGRAFKLGPMPRGRYAVRLVLGRGFPAQDPVTLDAPAEGIALRATRGITMVVRLEHAQPKSFHLRWLPAEAEAETPVPYAQVEPDGSFEFTFVDDALGTIYARNYRSGEMGVLRDVRAARGPYTLTPSMGETIAGKVVSPQTGRFRIRAVGPVTAYGSSAADGSGTFELKGLPPGKYDLIIEHAQGSAREDGVQAGRTDVTLTIVGR